MNSLKKFGVLLSLGIMMSIHTAVCAADMTITDTAGFINFVNQVNSGNSFAGSTVTLANDIDMEGVSWVPAGTKATPFAGTFDGNNHAIINLTQNFSADKTYVGVIGYNKGTVKNLTVEAAVPTGEGWDAGIGHWTNAGHNFSALVVGYNEGNISGCKSQGHLTVENQLSFSANGGICGYNRGTISDCTNEANINASNTTSWDKVPTIADCYSGGIAGLNEGTVTGCTNVYATLIKATGEYGSAAAGGIVGDNRKGGIISGCNSSGEMYVWIKFAVNMGYAYAGGVAGSNGGIISDTNANQARVKGVVEGTDTTYRFNYADVGGVVGYNYGTIENCKSNTTEISGGVKNYFYPSYEAFAGGIVGYNKGTVSNVESTSSYKSLTHNSVEVSPDYLGGICGYNEGGIISRATSSTSSISYPDLNGRKRFLGGIAAVNDGGYINLCQTKTAMNGATNGNITTGGIAGDNTGVIENCYNSGAVKGYIVGGIAGNSAGSIIDCYSRMSNTNTVGTYKDGIAYINNGYVQDCYSQADTATGTKLSMSALRKAETYSAWDFDVFWEIVSGQNSGYPIIKSQIGEFEFFGEGNGTAAAPYMITNQAELNRIRYQPNKHYRLMNDITMSGNWSPIGNSKANAFTGVFDGNGHTLSGLSLNGNGNEYNGLFGYIDGAQIYNLTIENAVYTLNESNGKGVYIGGVAGFARNNAVIENCSFDGKITTTSPVVTVGGIAGDFEGTIKGCLTAGDLIINGSGEYVYSTFGGICGKAEGTVSGCNSSVAITASANDASGYPMETSGGLVGRMKGTIADSCFDGTVSVTDSKTVYHGGVAGSIDGSVANSYSNYAMNYSNNISGAVAGQVMQGDVTTSYYNSSTSYDAFGKGVTSVALNSLRVNATEKKYIWVASTSDKEPEPLHVSVEWVIEDGFTKCKLVPNTDNITIYYTTDGTTPTRESTKYTGPFLADLMDKISYFAVSGTATTDVMGFVSAPQSKNLVQIASIPTNQDGQALTVENVSAATKVNVALLTEEDLVGARIFFVVFASDDSVIYANTTLKTLVKGSNDVEFNNVNIPSNGEKIQIYVWDDEEKLTPRSDVIKL